MRTYKKFILFLFCASITGYFLNAQSSQTKKYGRQDGLPHPTVYNITKDSQGRIWCATETGLALYKGDKFIPMVNNFTDPNSVNSGLLFTFGQDAQDRLWCGTYRNGISIYDIATNTFQYINDKTDSAIFHNSTLWTIQPYRQDSLFINTSNGSYIIDSKTLSSRKFADSSNLMMIDKSDTIHLLRDHGEVLSFHQRRLVRTIEPILGQASAMWMNSLDNTLLVSSFNGIYQIKNNKTTKLKIMLNGKDISSTSVNGLEIEGSNIYLMNQSYGLLKLVRENGSIWHCEKVVSEDWYQSGNSIYSSFYDKKDKSFFIGTMLGLYRIGTSKKEVSEIASEDIGTVKTIRTNSNTIYLGTEDGIFSYKDNQLLKIKEKKIRPKKVFISNSCQQGEELHFGGWGKYVVKENMVIELTPRSNKFLSSENQILVTTLWNGDLLLLGGNSSKVIIKDFNGNIKKEIDLTSNLDVFPPLIQQSDSIVILKTYATIYSLNINSGKMLPIVLDGGLMPLDLFHSKNKLFIATASDGIQILDENYNKIDSIDFTSNGLPNQVSSIIVRDSIIWFSNQTGIGKVNMNTKKITFLESGDAFQTTNFSYSSKAEKGDSILFGGENGAVIINTKEFNKIKQDFNTFIMLPSVYRDGKKYNLTKDQEETLSYNQNNLEYQIVHTNYSYPSMVRFQYRLNEGMPWIQADKSGLLKLYNLPPDHYNLQVKDQNTDKIVASRKFIINPPWYQTWWFRILLGLAIMANIIYITRLYYRRRIIAQQKELEKQKALQSERDRISRDLHDDIGSGLSAMKLQAEYLESLPQDKWTKDNLHELVDESQELTTSMREIVWSLNTQYDNLTDFVQYVRRYGVQYFDKSSITLDIDVPMDVANREINGLKRRNIFLVFKEALHNVLKHSQATEVAVQLTILNDVLAISIKDNGIGFDQHDAKGNGLHSMQYRMESIKGKYDLSSSKEGTETTFSVKL